jgi:peptidoglycan hydrolase-like protein with peptidoglycan-binding domain
MILSPNQTRLALASFLVIGLGVAVNVLYLQEAPVVGAPGGQKAERVFSRAEIERQRRLALTDNDLPRRTTSAEAASPVPEVRMASAVVERVGRFAPTASRFGRLQLPETDTEARAIEVVRTVQRLLSQRGYDPGPADGLAGTATRAAVLAYEHDHRLPLTAEPSEAVLQHLQTGIVPDVEARPGRAGRMTHAEQLVRSAQESLARLGYFAGRIDGFPGPDTVRAIRDYEMDSGLVPTGRVSAPLLQRLARGVNAPSVRLSR